MSKFLFIVSRLLALVSLVVADFVCENITRSVVTFSRRPDDDVNPPTRYGPGVYYGPSAETTIAPLGGCIPNTDVEVVQEDFGPDRTPAIPVVKVVEQGVSTVTYQVYHPFDDTAEPLPYIATDYLALEGARDCYKVPNVEQQGPLPETVTALCVDGFADIKVLIRFEALMRVSSSIEPGCPLDRSATTASYRLPCSSGCEDTEPLSLRAAVETDSPSNRPSASPTTSTPTPAPTVCIPKMDVETVSDFGTTFTPIDDVVKILQQTQDGSSVLFSIEQHWKLLELGWVGAEYETENGLICYGEKDALSGPLKNVMTAACVDGVATVSVLARDECFLPENDLGPQTDIDTSIFENCDQKPTLTETVGTTAFQSPPIEIISYAEEEVTFRVSQVWKATSLDSLWTHYATSESSVACERTDKIDSDFGKTYTATCSEGFADVDLYVKDSSFSAELDKAMPPSYCHVSTTEGKVVGYSFRVPCVCDDTQLTFLDEGAAVPPDERRRLGRKLSLVEGACSVDALTIKATFKLPCSPGCNDVEPLSLDLPTDRPTATPTSAPTRMPTPKPTMPPVQPTERPTVAPTSQPTPEPVLPWPYEEGDCPYVVLDFNKYTEHGDYVTDFFFDEYGVLISARSEPNGHTPDGAARLYNTSDSAATESKSLLTPNVFCGDGPGQGSRGFEGSPTENCEPLGMALIVQNDWRGITDPPKSYGSKTWITFKFARPVTVKKVVMVDSTRPVVAAKLFDGSVTTRQAGRQGKQNGVEHLTADVEGVVELEVYQPNSGGVAQIDFIPCDLDEYAAMSQLEPGQCPDVNLDFNDEEIFTPGAYITDQLREKYSVQIHVTPNKENLGAYAPGGAARVFDSTNPPWSDRDLGSPNRNCPGGGNGNGRGGEPGSAFENCIAHGNLLIIQEKEKEETDDSKWGGTISFKFDGPTYVKDTGVIDVDKNDRAQVFARTYDGLFIPYYVPKMGDNGYYKIEINQPNVIELRFIFTSSTAITHVNYSTCATGKALEWVPPDEDGGSVGCTDCIDMSAYSWSWQEYSCPWKWLGGGGGGGGGGDKYCPYFKLDFNELQTGEYITDDLSRTYGVVIQAKSYFGGHTPNGAARVFDTENPGKNVRMGSPNKNCRIPGLGDGSRGNPGEKMENCKPLGKALIIQAGDRDEPFDHRYGGSVTFNFVVPVTVKQIVFISTKQPTLSMTLTDGSKKMMVGPTSMNNGVYPMTVDVENIVKLVVSSEGNAGIVSLDYFPCLVETFWAQIEPSSKCGDVIKLDFNDEGFQHGDYISSQLRDKYGIRIKAKPNKQEWGAYAPNGALRVYNSSTPHSDGRTRGICSPNQKCANPGPGKGTGGEPSSQYANCDELGNVLIIQAKADLPPQSNRWGGSVKFKFDKPSYVGDIGLVSVGTDTAAEVIVTLWDGSRIPYKPPTTGYNGVYTQTVKMFDVVEIEFILLDAVGISHISLSPCPTDDAEEWIAPTPSPTQAPTLPTALLG